MYPRQLFVCATLLIASVSASAAQWVPDLQHLDAIPMHSLPSMQMQKAVSNAVSKNNPMQFAVSASMPLALDDGSWQQLEDGSWSWRTRVFSAGARSLNLHFSKFHLPPGANLWLYDPNGQVIAGPYTHANELGDGQLWTSIINGETAIAEVRVPDALKDQVQLQISEVNHGYRNFAKAGGGVGQFGDSGSCEINLVCPAGAAYVSNQARALALISISGEYLCSGQLINNVRQDNTPYFLTANHCTISSSNASSVVFYWNYQSSLCTPTNQPSSNQTQSGSIWVAGDVTSDFTLIKPAQQPSSSFNLYLSGWYAGTDAPTSGGVIHHPEGDVAKVAVYTAPASKQDNATLCTSANCATSRQVDVWQVQYSQGITEEGSSGSALYNQNGLIVGQLSGGNTSCTAGQSAYDIYGRLDAAWTANTASSGQLKANLDPDGTGTLTLAGQNLGAVVTSTSGSSSSSSGTSSSTTSGTTSGSSSSSASSGSSSGGGALPPATLLGLLALRMLRRRATSRRASST